MVSAVQKRLLSLGGTVAVAGAIGAYAYFGTFKGKQKEEETKSAEEKIASFKAADVSEVTLHSKGTEFVITGTGEGERKWQITKPITTLADKSTIDGIVNQFADMKRKRAFDAQPGDLKSFGLEPPLSSIAFKTADKTTTYLVGKKNSFDDVVYLERDGDTKVALVPVAAQTQTDRDLFALRDKRLAIFEDKDVAKIEVTFAGKPAYALEKKGEDWDIVGATRADKSQVTTILSSLRFLRAKSIPAERAGDGKAFGLDKPDVVVTLTVGAAGASLPLSFGSVKKGTVSTYYAKQAGDAPVLEIQEDMVKKLDLKTADLRDKSIASFDRDQVKKVSLAEAGKEIVLEKGAAGWALTAPEQGPAQDARVMNVLYKLGGLKAKAIAFDKVDAAAKKTAGLEAPAHEIKLMKADGTVLADVAFGAEHHDEKAGDEIYVLSQGGARIDLVEKGLLNDVKYTVADYEKAEPVAAAADKDKPAKK